jgi:hypothetical protein
MLELFTRIKWRMPMKYPDVPSLLSQEETRETKELEEVGYVLMMEDMSMDTEIDTFIEDHFFPGERE